MEPLRGCLSADESPAAGHDRPMAGTPYLERPIGEVAAVSRRGALLDHRSGGDVRRSVSPAKALITERCAKASRSCDYSSITGQRAQGAADGTLPMSASYGWGDNRILGKR